MKTQEFKNALLAVDDPEILISSYFLSENIRVNNEIKSAPDMEALRVATEKKNAFTASFNRLKKFKQRLKWFAGK